MTKVTTCHYVIAGGEDTSVPRDLHLNLSSSESRRAEFRGGHEVVGGTTGFVIRPTDTVSIVGPWHQDQGSNGRNRTRQGDFHNARQKNSHRELQTLAACHMPGTNEWGKK